MRGAREIKKQGGGKRLLGVLLLLAALPLVLTAGRAAVAVPVRRQLEEPQTDCAEVQPEAPEKSALSVAEEEVLPPVVKGPVSPVVPESEPVEDSYFSDVVFLGDSRTEGFSLYSGLKEGQYLYSVGATVESVFTKATQPGPGGKKVPMLDALTELECGKVYIMLGVNELGWVYPENFRDQYAKVIDRVREDHPEATVVIQSILPVSARQEAKKSYVNNGRIAVYNQLLEELAAEEECPYLNVMEAVTGEDGCLRPELTSDGIHLNTAGCRAWLDYLRTHSI